MTVKVLHTELEVADQLIIMVICGPTQNNRPYLENEKVLKLDKQNLSSA